MTPLLCTQTLHKRYGSSVHALKGISLQVMHSEIIAITGQSGSGKSTLLHILGCLETPSFGSYQFLGREVATLSDAALSRIRRHNIGFVFQSYHLIPYLTVAQNVELPLLNHNLSRETIHARVQEALCSVGMAHRLTHRPGELSGGEAQRVAIARALVIKPQMIVADEPTGSLDSYTTGQILDLLWRLRSSGVALVMATHNTSIAAQCDRTLVLRDGTLN